MLTDELRLTDPSLAGDAAFIAQVRTALDLPADARLQLQTAARTLPGGARIEYAVTVPIVITGVEFGVAAGVTVDERTSVALQFDARGALVSSQVTPVDEKHLRAIKTNVQKLAATDQIYVATFGEAIDPDVLRAQGKPWYIETDADARKRLRRAYMG